MKNHALDCPELEAWQVVMALDQRLNQKHLPLNICLSQGCLISSLKMDHVFHSVYSDHYHKTEQEVLHYDNEMVVNSGKQGGMKESCIHHHLPLLGLLFSLKEDLLADQYTLC